MKRYAYVDLLRGFAALSILIYHYRWFYARAPLEWRTDVILPLPQLLGPIYEHGGLAVNLFWSLSGFVFAMAYGHYGRQIPVRDFVVHRFARLYPLHFATLIVVALLQVISQAALGGPTIFTNNDLSHFFAQLIFASNWFTVNESFNGPIWSVSVEVLIYAIFLIYMRVAGLNLWSALAIAATGYVASRIPHAAIPVCALLFFLGVAMAIVLPKLHSLVGRALPWLAFGGLAITVAAIAGLRALGYYSHADRLIMLGLPTVVVFLFSTLDLRLPPLPSAFHWIGAITYAVYLIHMPIIISAKLLSGERVFYYLDNPWALAAYVGFVVALAVTVHYAFELPSQRFLRGWLSDEKKRG